MCDPSRPPGILDLFSRTLIVSALGVDVLNIRSESGGERDRSFSDFKVDLVSEGNGLFFSLQHLRGGLVPCWLGGRRTSALSISQALLNVYLTHSLVCLPYLKHSHSPVLPGQRSAR